MQNLKNSIDKIVADFGSKFHNNSQVQAALFLKEHAALNYEKDFRKYDEKKERERQEYEVKSKKLLKINDHIPYVRDSIRKAEEEQNLDLFDHYRGILADRKLERADLEKWMQNNNEPKNLDEYMNYELNVAGYEYNLEVGKRLAEWFATGAAGPGTVTFMDKEYTA